MERIDCLEAELSACRDDLDLAWEDKEAAVIALSCWQTIAANRSSQVAGVHRYSNLLRER